MWWDFRSDLLFCYHVFCADFLYVLNVQIDERIMAGDAATRLTVTAMEAAIAPACCSEASSQSGVTEIWQWFTLCTLCLKHLNFTWVLKHPIRKLFYWWYQFSHVALIKGIILVPLLWKDIHDIFRKQTVDFFFNLYYLTSDFCYKNDTSRDRKTAGH